MNVTEFAKIIDETKHIVLSAVHRYLDYNYYMMIDDVIQETYLNVYKGLKKKQLSDNKKINSWIYTIAKNESLRMNKKYVRQKKIESKAVNMFEQQKHIEKENEIVKNEFDKVLNNTEKLPEKYRVVFKKYVKGKSEKNISDELNIPLGTVKSRIHRAKNFIRQL